MRAWRTAFRIGPGVADTVILTAVWCLGLLTGGLLISRESELVLSWMRLAACGRVSIVGLLLGNLLPFLFSFVFLSLSMPRLLYAVCFFRALLFGFCAAGIGAGFGSAGWLVQCFLFFSDFLTMPGLFWCWIRIFTRKSGDWRRDLLVGSLAAAGVGIVDYLLVAPYLARLLSFWKG